MKGYATSYGDKLDMDMYDRALISFLKLGYTQSEAEAKARKVGDPGIGWMDNDLSDLKIPWVALPYEDWQARFGTKSKAHKAKVKVTCNGKTFIGLLGDTMPHKSNITNGAVIDLAPGAQALINRLPPFKLPVTWTWA